MTTFKTTSGNLTYNIAPVVNGASIGQGQGTFKINGNLLVTGTQTTAGANVVSDPFITVAANNIGTLTDMGMIAQKTSNTYAGFRFDSTANTWQISSSVNSDGSPITNYANILTSDSVAGSNTQIQFNNNNTFGASANLTFDLANSILGISGQVRLAGFQAFTNTATPTNIANTVILYSNDPGVGGTGLYFTSNVANDELISKSKSIVYSLIF
jgi:hypothetical protein